MILRAYKYRIYPTKQQAAFLNEVFGSVRFVWNQLVANFNSWTPDSPLKPLNEKILKGMPEYSWLADSISYALQQKRIDFEETRKQFFNKNRKTKLGRMKFKKKGVSKESFRIPAASLGGMRAFDIERGTIKLTKMTPIKMVVDRKFTGTPKSVTVSRNKCNQYFVSILVEEELELKQNTGRSVGIDLGLNHLVTLSNGIKFDNPRWFRESQAKLKRAQQHLSRKVKGSNRYNVQKLKVAKIHNKIANQRGCILHNISSWLVNNFDTIIVEDLNVAGMKKSNLAKSVSDASFSTLVSMIDYKSKWYGRTFHRVDRWYPSSKTCNNCGYKMDTMTLNIREWTCPSCGEEHDRDLNAAKNILDEGLRDLYDFTSDELAEYRRGELVRPKVNLPKADSVKRLASFINFDRNA